MPAKKTAPAPVAPAAEPTPAAAPAAPVAPVAPAAPAIVRFVCDYPSVAVFVDGEYFVRFVDGAAEALETDPAVAVLRTCADVREVLP